MSMAERLSRNRAARRAATDPVPVEHINRIYHMHRRIEDNYSRTERLKDPWDSSVHPVYVRRGTNAYMDMLKAEVAAWRPSSAPAWAGGARRGGQGQGQGQGQHEGGDSYSGWSVRESMPAAFPTSRYVEARRGADAAVYKRAIMAEVVDSRLYREADLRQLFKAYLRLAPPGDRETVQRVVEELKRELDVR